MNPQLKELLRAERCVHILYSYKTDENYIRQAVKFIQDGIKAKDYIVFIENERLYPRIYKELEKIYTEEELKYMHHVKNFDFYNSSGSYHPPAIVEYFNKTVKPYVTDNIAFRSWAHVEWATMEDPLKLVEELEQQIDNAVNQLAFPLICAYHMDRMPEYLSKILKETHPYLLSDDDFTGSEHYKSLSGE
ncbi:MEDS domain-containing protein [Sporosarcina gallistercoris]|uniref:MEDS domain-containing protein n=1 Tax=Sporosarcina gallistercoris TaxID=2762245 RepID=UPI003D2913E1